MFANVFAPRGAAGSRVDDAVCQPAIIALESRSEALTAQLSCFVSSLHKFQNTCTGAPSLPRKRIETPRLVASSNRPLPSGHLRHPLSGHRRRGGRPGASSSPAPSITGGGGALLLLECGTADLRSPFPLSATVVELACAPAVGGAVGAGGAAEQWPYPRRDPPLSHGGGQILPRGGASSLPELAGGQLSADPRLSSLLRPGGAPSRAAGPVAAPQPRPAACLQDTKEKMGIRRASPHVVGPPVASALHDAKRRSMRRP
ncbi:hypothetical protein PVAP13_2NG360300 [Panicum virgatum]|uniref:Uncharacterized protein n=1 Tax=Panicum virgatum TaxID=38727 RepID=A0A8T0VM61_PANVG|nr:hypothetical protein PVAP13_2NG360300 [Panicum virgatum]